nr:PREDICTED: mitochondrial import inner membrane translocase subunit TIM50-A-like [Bemisia tabaci]
MAGVQWKCIKNSKKLLNNFVNNFKNVTACNSASLSHDSSRSVHNSASDRSYASSSFTAWHKLGQSYTSSVRHSQINLRISESLALSSSGFRTLNNSKAPHCCMNQSLCLFHSSTNLFSEKQDSQSDKGGGSKAPPDEDEEAQRKERESYWRTMKLSFICLGASFGIGGGFLIYELGPQKRDADGNIIEDEFSHLPPVKQLFSRIAAELQSWNKMLKKPSRDKLLPDPLEPPYHQPPYTLILELTDLLVHPDWTYQTGWRFKKRPNVDAFLEKVGPPLFEIVIYTAEQGLTVFPIIDSLDPKQMISYRLVRDATEFVDGHHVKNLDCINRDLSKVIVVDWNPDSVKLHPNNALVIPRWKGQDTDRTLVDLAAFLQTIAINQVEDVREVLQYYRQFDDPLETFKENQRKFLEQQEERRKAEEERKKNKPLAAKWSGSLFSSGPKI